MDAVESLKEKMVLACKVLQNRGVVDVYGHVSARLPGDRILSTPHMPPGKVALRDLIILDMHGMKLEGFGEPNGETAMHTSIYKARPDVQCVLHYHPDELVAISISGHGIKVVANCGVHFYRGTPIYDSPVLIRTDELGDKIAATLGDRKRGALARAWRHGGGQRSRHVAAPGTRSGAHGPDPNHGLFSWAAEDALPSRMRANGQIPRAAERQPPLCRLLYFRGGRLRNKQPGFAHEVTS
ncbi:MAG TPA: class II aldolase/adducin family protein [Candidatus Binatia bacterium]